MSAHRVSSWPETQEFYTHINSNACNADPLLHNLQPNDQLHATASMQLPTADTKQHRVITVRASCFPLMLDDVLDILVFRLSPRGILALAATQSSKNVVRFLVSAHFGQPARALGKEPADAEKYQQRDDLEGDGKSPADGRVSVVDKAEAEFEPVGDLVGEVSDAVLRYEGLSVTFAPLLLATRSGSLWCTYNNAENVQSELNRDELSSRGVIRGLGGPYGYNGVQNSCTPAIDKAGHDHPDVILGRTLQRSTKDSPGSSKCDSAYATDLVAHPAANEAAYKSS